MSLADGHLNNNSLVRTNSLSAKALFRPSARKIAKNILYLLFSCRLNVHFGWIPVKSRIPGNTLDDQLQKYLLLHFTNAHVPVSDYKILVKLKVRKKQLKSSYKTYYRLYGITERKKYSLSSEDQTNLFLPLWERAIQNTRSCQSQVAISHGYWLYWLIAPSLQHKGTATEVLLNYVEFQTIIQKTSAVQYFVEFIDVFHRI